MQHGPPTNVKVGSGARRNKHPLLTDHTSRAPQSKLGIRDYPLSKSVWKHQRLYDSFIVGCNTSILLKVKLHVSKNTLLILVQNI
jgi:hypothetical protein